MKLLRRLAAWFDRKAERSAVVEECEQRILYSADLNPAMWSDGGNATTSNAIVRTVDQQVSAPTVESTAAVHAQHEQRRHEIVFVDAAVPDAQKLIESLLASRGDAVDLEVVRLRADADGLEQIHDVLAGERGVDAVHIISHGGPGRLQLGSLTLDATALAQRSRELKELATAFSADADLMIYGCDVARGDAGQAFVQELSRLTGADVAASDDATGHESLGGDWELEVASGTINTGVVFSETFRAQWMALLPVTNLQPAGDTYIKLRTPDDTNNFGASTDLIVDRESTDLQRALLQFDLSSIPANAIINSATLQMQAWQVTGTLNINVYEMLQAWVEGTGNGTAGAANWNQSAPATNWTTAGGTFNSTAVATLNTNAVGQHSWSLTALVQAWVDGSKVNNGLMVASPDGGGNRTATYYSSEGTTPPVLVIDYTIPATAPTLDASKSPALSAIAEDAGAPVGAVGTLVSELVDFASPSGQVDNVTDPNTGALLGIAVTAADTSSGSWWYSTNGGINWNALGAVANNSAKLLAADASTRLYFQPNANYNGTLASAITFRAWDQTSGSNGASADTTTNGGATAFSTATDTASLTVTAVNDAPNATNLSAAETYTEDTALNLTDIVISDVDSANVTATLTLSNTAAGSLSTGTSGAVTSTYNAGTGVWTASGAIANVNSLLAGLTFTPTANFNSNFTIATSVSDGVAAPITGSKAITGTPVNDAPVLDNTKSPTLSATNEDAGSPVGAVGTLVSALVDFASPAGQVDNVTDVDAGAQLGIAVTGADTTNGTWWYSTDGGTNWNALSIVTNSSARLLAADANTRLYFQANANWNGTLASAITFRAWDRTNGSNGALIDTSANGGSTAFSSATDTASLVVNAVNDAPVLDNTGTMVLDNVGQDNSNPPGTTVAAIIASAGGDRITDVDSGALEGIAITARDNSNGTWQYSINGGASWLAVGNVNGSQALLLSATANDMLRFVPGAGFSGNASITFRAWDRSDALPSGTSGVNTNTNGGSTPFSSATQTASVYVEPLQVLLWMSTTGDVSGSGVSGLSNWTQSTVLTLGDPGLSLGAGTTGGRMATVANFDGFAVDGDVNINGLHFVNRAVTLSGAGIVAGPLNLLKGDMLFVTASNETLSTAAGSPPAGWASSISTTAGDVYVFRPVTNGDYSSGYFRKVMNGPGPNATRDIALVETATTVGGTALAAGDILFTQAGNLQQNNIYWYQTAANSTSLLVDGSQIGIPSGGSGAGIDSLDLVQTNFTSGGFTFQAGDVIAGFNTQVNAVGSGGSTVTAYAQDLVRLRFTATTYTAGTAVASAVTMLDGANIKLDTAGENLDAVGLLIQGTGANVAPAVTLPGAALAYTEGAGPVIVDAGATVGDIDSPDLNTGVLRVDLTVNGTPDDRLAIRNQGTGIGQIGVSGSNVTYNFGAGAVTIGTFAGGTDGSTPLLVTLNASATPAAVQALLSNVTYENVSNNPSAAPRTLRVLLSDGDGATSSAVGKTINVTNVNSTPVAANDAYSVNEDSTLVVAPTTANLANLWGFNEGSGQAVTSGGSLGSGGTLGSTAGVDAADPTWTTGYVGGSALAFNGAGQFVDTTSTDLKTASNFTLSAWFQTNTTTGAQHLLWQGYPGGNGYGNGGSTTSATSEMSLSIGSYTATYDNKIVFFLGYDVPANGADCIFIASASNFTDTGNWHNVAVTVTDLGGGVMQASLYVDGKLEGTDTGSQNDRSVWGALRIGAPGDGTRSFNGKIDDVRVYSTALAAGSVQGIATAGVLGNDSDTDGPTLRVNTAVVTGPANGTLSISQDGSFTYTPNANFFGTDSFTYRANDGALNSNVATVTITVNPVNDAPTLSATAVNPAFTEAAGLGTQAAAVSVFSGAAANTIESGQTFSGLTFTVSGLVDGASEAIVVDGRTITLGATSSGTTATNALAYTSTVSGGTATIVLSGGSLSAAAAQTLVNTISYQNTNTDNPSAGNRVFTLTQVQDSGGTANGGVDARALSIASTVTVTGVNDAPTLGNGTLAAVAEDTAGPAGQTIATIFAGQFADVDGGSSLSGIAVVGNTANAGTQGVWQYSTNSGTNWFAIGTVADGSTALALSSSTLVRFVPVANYNGTPPALSVRGLDNTYAGGFSSTAVTETRVTVNTTTNGGGTPIAAATANLSTSVTAVNDPPVNTVPSGQYTPFNTALVFSAANGNQITIADPDAAASPVQVTLTVGNGTLTLAGTAGLTFTGGANGSATMTFTGTVSSINAALNGLSYLATTNYRGLDTLQIATSDLGNTGSGGTLTDTDSVKLYAGALVVTNTSDASNGTTTSISSLVANDGGDGISLREAIAAANNTAGADTIAFAIATGGSVKAITLTSALPTITDAVTIDGTTQTTLIGDSNPGALGSGGTVGVDGLTLSLVNRPEVEIRGDNSIANGLDIQASNSTIRGLAIYGFGSGAYNNNFGNIVVRSGVSGTLIEGNVLGSGASAFVDPGAGLRTGGVNILFDHSASATVTNNLIGFAGGQEIWAYATSTGLTITNNEIRGNGLGAFNWLAGVDIDGGANHLVSGNLIAGKIGAGINLSSTTGTEIVRNNTVTLNGLGNNATAGVSVAGGTGALVEKNVISSNVGSGVLVANAASGVTISRNAIFGNGPVSGQIGIDLLNAGDNQARGSAPFVTPNDAGDADIGANNLQNFPVLTSANSASGNTTIIGTLNSTANTTLRIEFFSSATGDGSGYGEGQVYLGFTSVTTDGSGNASFNAVLTGVTVTAGHVVSATATVDLGGGNYGSTSEFAANVVATNIGPGINVSAISGNTSEAGASATFTVSLNTAPTADVTIAVSSSNTLAGTVSTSLLTFTSANWNVAQTVTVTGVDDNRADGNAGYTVLLAPATSADGSYSGLDASDVAVTNVDNDSASITVTPVAVSALGGETRVNTTTGGDQNISANVGQAIATDANGNFVVVWASNLQDGSAYGIYGQRFSADGAALGGEFLVNTTTADDQILPSVAMDATGNFVVTWSSNNQDGSGYGVYAQRYNSAGVAQGAEFRVSTTTAGSQITSQVAMSSSGGFVIVWSSAQDPDASTGIYGQRYDAAGVAQGGEFRVNSYTVGIQQLASVAMADSGSFVVTWASDLQDGSNYGVYGQLFAANGAAQGSEFRVNTTTANSQLYQDVAMLGDGRFVVVYQSRNADGTFEVYLQRYAANGTAVGGETRVNATTVSSAQQPIPSVSADAGGNITVVWNSAADGSGIGVVGRRFSWNGSAIGAEFQVNTTTSGDQLWPEVVSQPGGRFIVAWSGNGTGDADGVFFQRYGMATTEAGTSATFQVGLASQPTADVTITIASGDATEGTVSPTTLTFTSANWNVLQTVTVFGVQDYASDGDVAYNVMTSTATSSDINYGGLNAADVCVTNREIPNVAPVNTVPGAQSVNEDGTLVFSSGNGNLIAIGDADAGSNPVRVTLTGTNGTLTLSGTTGLTFTVGDGSADATMTFTGTVASVNSALAGMSFNPTANFNGASSLQIVTNDLGNTGTGGALSDTDTIAITVNAVNDAPTAADDRLALNFDGVDDYVTIPSSPSLVMNSTMTLEAWINPDLSSNSVQIIANKEGEYELAVFADGSLNFAFAEGGAWNWHNTGATIARNTWTHVAVTYNAGAVSTYVNGVLVDSQTLATTTIDDVYPALNELRIGGRSNNPAGQYFDGRIADVRVWDVVRSPVQIAGAMNGPLTGAEAGLVGYWVLDENSGTTVNDGTANGNTGTLVNGASWAGYRIDEDTTLTAVVPGVLANDYDPDGNSLTAILVTGPAHGSLTLNANGSFIYMPAANWHGTDSFTYKANDGTSDSNIATVSVLVDPVSDAPTGAPVIGGIPAEDQVLTASTATIADGDGLGAFSYQWQRNGVNIAGATASTYTLGDIDVGTNIRVIVSYTDGDGTAESLTSAAVGPIANVNDAPTGVPVVTGTPTEDQVLGVNTSSIADADGLGTFTYQWQRNGTNIVGATGSTYTLGDADVGTNIRVVVSYTDGNGTAESLTSAAVGPIANVNDVPTGAPVVTGTPTEDQVLGVNTSSIADADGLGTFSYQWQRNGSNIVGATGSTYTLGDADVGTNIRVIVSYTDGQGTAESLTSAAVGPVANVNDAPTGAPVVTGTPTEDQVLGIDTNSIADADGLGTFSYQWQRNGSNIVGATGSTYTLGDADVGTNIRVIVSYTDGQGTSESLTSAAVGPIANVNDAPTGAPVVTGTPTEDQVLTANTATIADADGLGTFSYQWQRNGTNIVGATGSTYTLGDADVGTNIRVVVSYTDGQGTAESLTSATVGPIANVNDAPTGAPVVTGTPTEDQVLTANTGSIADADGLGAFSYQWQRNGVSIVGATALTYTLGDSDVGTNIRVIVSYTDGQGTAESLTSAAVGPIANVNDAPVITSNGGGVSAAVSVAENQTAATTVTSTDVDGGAPVYSIVGGADAALFTIDPATGALTFNSAPDFELPADAGGDNIYDVSVQVADGNGGTAMQAIAVTVTNVNEAPVITSGALVSVVENQTGVISVTSTDVDGGVPVYTISGGADAMRFSIDAATGVLTFNTAPNFEAPIDAGADNVYDVTVQVADGNGGIDTQAIAVTVTNVNDVAPVITSNGGGASASVTLGENGISATTVTASDADGPSLTYSIVGGADQALFTIDSATGVLSFNAAPDFEAPADANADNVYDVVVQASDGVLSGTQAISFGVSNVNEAPTALTPGSAVVDVQAVGGTSVATLTATDPDSGDTLRFTLVDDGGGRFAIDASSGQLALASGARLDDQGGAPFVLVVRVTDAAGLTFEQPFVVSLSGLPPQAVPDFPPLSVPAPPREPAAPAEPAAPSPRATATPTERAAERLVTAGAPDAGVLPRLELPDSEDDRSTDPRVRLNVRLREDGSAYAATVSFGDSGSPEGAGVVLSWDDMASRSMDAVWRALAAAMPRGVAIELEDGLGSTLGGGAQRDELAALLMDPVQVSSVTFAAGFVWWLTRSGGLLTTLLMGIPAWRQVDLLPVLARDTNDEDDEDDPARDDPEETRPDDLDDAAVAALFDRARGAAGRPERV